MGRLLVLVDSDLRMGRPLCSIKDLKEAVASEVRHRHITSRRSLFGQSSLFARPPALLEQEVEEDVQERMRLLLSGRAASEPPEGMCSVVHALEASLTMFAEDATVCVLFGMGSDGGPLAVAPEQLSSQWMEALIGQSQPSLEHLFGNEAPAWLRGASAILLVVAEAVTDRWFERNAAATASLRASTADAAATLEEFCAAGACPIIWACCKTAEMELFSHSLHGSWENASKAWCLHFHAFWASCKTASMPL